MTAVAAAKTVRSIYELRDTHQVEHGVRESTPYGSHLEAPFRLCAHDPFSARTWRAPGDGYEGSAFTRHYAGVFACASRDEARAMDHLEAKDAWGFEPPEAIH